CLSGSLFVAFIPLGLCLIISLLKAIRLAYTLLILIAVLLGIAFFHNNIPWYKVKKGNENVYYRLENFPFSWKIAKKHPVIGIGLRSPRVRFLDSYEIKYPYVEKETFSKSVNTIVGSDNMFLTHMFNKVTPIFLFHPLALLIPIAATLLHFLMYDGLLFPQISWFFHLLLGII